MAQEVGHWLLSHRRPGFNSGTLHLGLVVDKETLKQLRVCPSVSVYPCHFSFTSFYHSCGRTDGQPHHRAS
jgi:hypothetical protein